MHNLKISLVDNDYVVRAKTDVVLHGEDDPVSNFFRQIKEELALGQTAHLEIEGSDADTGSFEITLSA